MATWMGIPEDSGSAARTPDSSRLAQLAHLSFIGTGATTELAGATEALSHGQQASRASVLPPPLSRLLGW